MSAILICPSSSSCPAVEPLSAFAPLAAIPLLGESLLEYWLAHLAFSGVKEVRILADDRPEQITALAGNGARWGLKTEVISEPRQLTPAQAQIKYASHPTHAAHSAEYIVVLDHFPGGAQSLFTSYANLFAGIFEWLPKAVTPGRVGVHELRPGIWTGAHTRIPSDAQLHAPCWIGCNVYLGDRAIVGPMAVIEDRAFVEPEAEIVGSMVGPDTFVGRFAALHHSLALGSTLIDWQSGLRTQVTDAFLLCGLRPAGQRDSFFARLAEIYSRNKDDLQMFWKHFLVDKEG